MNTERLKTLQPGRQYVVVYVQNMGKPHESTCIIRMAFLSARGVTKWLAGNGTIRTIRRRNLVNVWHTE